MSADVHWHQCGSQDCVSLTEELENVSLFYFKYPCTAKLSFFISSQYDFDYRRRPTEWVNPKAKTDYYKLVLSWSPSFCKTLPANQRNRTFQCQYDDFDLIV